METQKPGQLNLFPESAEEIIRLAKKHYGAKNYPKAMALFKEAAELGDRLGQFFLGSMYDEGLGVTQDYVKAVFWYKQAAEQGDPSAQARLGKIYLDGEKGVPKDSEKALYWFTKAGEQDCLGAPEHLRRKQCQR